MSTADDASRPWRADDEIFRRLVESVRDYAIFMLTPTGRIASWNSGAEAIKQYRADEVIGRHFSLFYEPMRSRQAGQRRSSGVPWPRDASRTKAGASARTAAASGPTSSSRR